MTNVLLNALKTATVLMATIATIAAGKGQNAKIFTNSTHLKRCIEDSGCKEDNQCPGFDSVCNIPAHDNCFYCDPTTDCTEGKECQK